MVAADPVKWYLGDKCNYWALLSKSSETSIKLVELESYIHYVPFKIYPTMQSVHYV